MTVACSVGFMWPTVLLTKHAMFVDPAHLLRFLENAGVYQLYLALAISSFCFSHVGWLGIKLGIVLDVLEYQ